MACTLLQLADPQAVTMNMNMTKESGLLPGHDDGGGLQVGRPLAQC